MSQISFACLCAARCVQHVVSSTLVNKKGKDPKPKAIAKISSLPGTYLVIEPCMKSSAREIPNLGTLRAKRGVWGRCLSENGLIYAKAFP